MVQALSARSNAPECHIGQADRFRQKQDVDFATGLFQHKGSLGPQGISTKPSLPSYSLGASTRDQMYKVRLRWGLGDICVDGKRVREGGGKQLVGQRGGGSWNIEEGWKMLLGCEYMIMQEMPIMCIITVRQTGLCKLLCITF